MFAVYFLLLLVPLVFFHELGHFLVARWMGVRVLSFSIGFGPVVLEWESGGTQYAIRALPLGGFVRMLGEDPTGEEGGRAELEIDGPLPEDSFPAKAVWRRALIVAAGPIANFILPVVILFVGSLMLDGQVVSNRVGTVLPGGPAARAGLLSGDRILSVDGEEIRHFSDLQRVVSARPGKRVAVVIDRAGQQRDLQMTTDTSVDARLPELGIVDRVGRIQVLPKTQAAIVAVAPDSVAWRAGLRSGDLVTKVDGKPTAGYWQLEEALRRAAGGKIALEVEPIYSAPKTEAVQKLVPEQGTVSPQQDAAPPLHDAAKTHTVQLDVPMTAMPLGIRPSHAVIGRVGPDSPAEKAGLRPGDELLTVDGRPVNSLFEFADIIRRPYDTARAAEGNVGLEGEELIARLNAAVATPFALTYRRAGPDSASVLRADLRLEVEAEKASKRPQLKFGIGEAQRYEAPEMTANPARIGYALDHTRTTMVEQIKVITLTVVGLFRGRVPMKAVGGPIFMAQIASRTADLGWGFFFHIMVWLSINLAILNLLPIPLVDGGQLLFLAIEAIKRKPVSLRTRMVASYVGMGFIFFIFVVVMKNDVERVIESFIQ